MRMLLKSLCLLLPITFFGDVLCKDYTNYTLFKAVPENESQLTFLSNLSDSYKVDFWVPPSEVNRFVEFIIPPEEKPYFFKECDKEKLELTTIIYNIQSDFEQQFTDNKVPDKYGWNNYFTLNETFNWLIEFQKHHPEVMEIMTIGKTAEGRPIKAIKVILENSTKRSSVVIEGGIHGREWISISFVTYMINAIVNAESSKDKVLKEIALTYEWYFIPILNPDGFHYSITVDRLWSKNRNDDHGVDLNSNFPYRFGTVGISTNITSRDYCGPNPFSESESKALRDFILTKSTNLEYYLSIHSYGQYLVIPYDHTKDQLDNYDDVKNMALEAISSISNRYGTEYTTGNLYETRGLLKSGSSTSWVKNAIKVPYVLAVYLRDKDMFGFALPPEQIIPTCAEILDGLLSFLQNRTQRFDKLDHIEHSMKPVHTPLAQFLQHPNGAQKCVLMKAFLMVLNFLFVFLIKE